MKIKTLVAMIATVIFTNHSMAGGAALSWNLSRDTIVNLNNQTGAWAFMQGDVSALHNPINYTLLPTYSDPCIKEVDQNNQNVTIANMTCWQNAASINDSGKIGITNKNIPLATVPLVKMGVLFIHPTPQKAYIVRWTSTITGNIDVAGRFSSIDTTCGDGIDWFIDHGTQNLSYGHLYRGEGATFLHHNVYVTIGQSLYFIVSPGNVADHLCDSTQLDLIITSQRY